jgi:hypothetical protein
MGFDLHFEDRVGHGCVSTESLRRTAPPGREVRRTAEA